jgi:hypothetical protein
MIEDAEAAVVFAIAVLSVRRMMTLIYSSCQRPEDCLRFGRANIKRTEKDGREIRILRVRQVKTTKSLDVELSGELEKLVNECLAEPVVHQTDHKSHSMGSIDMSQTSRRCQKLVPGSVS